MLNENYVFLAVSYTLHGLDSPKAVVLRCTWGVFRIGIRLLPCVIIAVSGPRWDIMSEGNDRFDLGEMVKLPSSRIEPRACH